MRPSNAYWPSRPARTSPGNHKPSSARLTRGLGAEQHRVVENARLAGHSRGGLAHARLRGHDKAPVR
eukprot:11163749-Lingulodinium_polyedra.AAC.1